MASRRRGAGMAPAWAPAAAPPSCRRRLGWSAKGPREGTLEVTDTVSSGGARPPGRRAWVLEFCLVFCTVSGLAQSSLWSLNFALDSICLALP